MSYGMGAALQAAVFTRLSGDAGLASIVGANVFDALPTGTLPALYVSLGPEKARDLSDGSGGGALHEFAVSVVTSAAGFHQAKEAAAAVSDALLSGELTLSRGVATRVQFHHAQALKSGADRRIDLWFRVRVSEG